MRTTILLLALGPAAFAQGVTVTTNPFPALMERPIHFRFCNQTGGPITLPNTQPWLIRQGSVVMFTATGQPGVQVLPHGACLDFGWDQRNWTGYPVPPGRYTFEIAWTNGQNQPQTTQSCFEVTITHVALCWAGIQPEGCPIRMLFRSPRSTQLQYYAACSFASTPRLVVAPCTEIPLAVDPLLINSLCTPWPVFYGFCGVLDGNGDAVGLIQPPVVPGLSGFSFWISFATLTPGAGAVHQVAPATRITLGPPAACPCP
jgi:hypothetical protein